MNLWFVLPALLTMSSTLAIWTALRLIFWARAAQNVAGAISLLSEALIMLGFLCQTVTSNYQSILIWNFIALVGLWLLCQSWLCFVMLFTGYSGYVLKWVNKVTLCLFGLICIILLTIYLIPATSQWILTPYGLLSFGPYTMLNQKLGWVGTLLVILGLFEGGVSAAFLFRLLKKLQRPYQIRIGILIAGVLAICIALVLQIFNLNPVAPLSPIMLAFLPSCILKSWVFFSLRVGKEETGIRERIVESMRGCVIVLDSYQRVTYVNPAAARISKIETSQALRKPIAEVVPEIAAYLTSEDTQATEHTTNPATVEIGEMVYSIGHSVIRDWKGEASGQTLVLHNITDRERLEQTLQTRANELARSGAFTQALSQVAARVAASAELNQVYQTTSAELHQMNIEFMVALNQPGKTGFAIEYFSLNSTLLRQLERVTGIPAKGFKLPAYVELEQLGGIKKGSAIFFPHILQPIQKMVSKLSSIFEHPIMNAVGISFETAGYIIPLATQHENMGIFIIWGPSLYPDDLSTLSSFAAQVSAALQKARLIDNERQQNEELKRSNGIIISLAQVAARFEANLKTDEIMDVLGTELKKINVTCFVAILDPQTDELTGQYTSVSPGMMHLAESISKVDLHDFRIPYKTWQIQDPYATGPASIIEDPLTFASNIIHFVPKMVLKKAITLVGITPNTPALWLPLRAGDRLLGILVIWGIHSPQQHLPAFSIFARQVAAAIDKARLIADLEELKSFNEGIVQGVAEAIVMFDGAGHVTFANPAASRLIGWPAAELVGQSWRCFIPEADQLGINELMEQLGDKNETGIEITLLRRNGSTIPALLNAQPWLIKGQLESLLISLVDIEQRVVAEQKLRASNQEKEALLKEIHHRVKNNLQIISSLLNLQSNQLKDPAVVDIFRESQNRVRAMALIHEKLYRSENLGLISFNEYIHDLGRSLVQAYNRESSPVRLMIQADPIPMDIDTAIPCGLIVNELITNSLKHAFNAQSSDQAENSPWIKIELNSLPENKVRLHITDNGCGFPPDFDFIHISSLGINLINSLVRQIEGQVAFSNKGGANIEIEF